MSSNIEYFKKFSTEYPNPFNYFYSKIRLETFTYDKSVEHMDYKKVLIDSINNDFPKKEQLLKAKRDWVMNKYKSILQDWWKIPKEFHEIIARFSDNYDDHDNNLNEKVINSDEDSYNSKDNADDNIGEKKDSIASIDDIGDTTSEESEDFSLVEFNSYEIKKDAKKFYSCLEMFLNQLECAWELPLYIQKSSKINESSYSHQVIKSVCDLLLYNIKGVNIEYNGQSGPTRLPDLMVSKSFRSPNYKWEFMFCEISNGPYALDWDHYWGDELRLGKFSKDSWNNVYLLTQGIDASDQLLKEMMDELNHVMIHFYGTKMDIYILDLIRDTTHKQQRTKDNTNGK
ncbi:17047_t:CDS:2 [Racocetra fulgida]|uniref:17047_t:CDS:1 n=1 Tax=Racocetra fulgida TaxID=60492 RepID=A0A9N9HSE6_9GLOM|nr:17047_t:CDS:2 [Racocetra fulgida]